MQFRKLALQCYGVTSLELRNGKVNRQKCAGGRRLTRPVGTLREMSGTAAFRLSVTPVFRLCSGCVQSVCHSCVQAVFRLSQLCSGCVPAVCHNCVRNVPVALLVTHCDWPAANCRFRRVQSVAYRGPEVWSSGTVQCRTVYPSARPDLPSQSSSAHCTETSSAVHQSTHCSTQHCTVQRQ